jgi:hypothetical protein
LGQTDTLPVEFGPFFCHLAAFGYNLSMEQRDKALKVAVTAIVILAAMMFGYYWITNHTRKSENDLTAEKGSETPREEKLSQEYAGIYSTTDSIEGLEHRLGFFSLNRKDDGSGYFGTAKIDTVGAAESATSYLKCNDANITEKEFFVKCSDPDFGQISFSGETKKDAQGTIQATGNLLWSKGGTEITNKATTFTRTGSN